MSDDKNVRHRFTVPAADDVVNKWIENQSNLGFSLRVLKDHFQNSKRFDLAVSIGRRHSAGIHRKTHEHFRQWGQV